MLNDDATIVTPTHSLESVAHKGGSHIDEGGCLDEVAIPGQEQTDQSILTTRIVMTVQQVEPIGSSRRSSTLQVLDARGYFLQWHSTGTDEGEHSGSSHSLDKFLRSDPAIHGTTHVRETETVRRTERPAFRCVR